MKKIIGLLLISNFALAQAQQISIKCTQTADYCGGAPPPQEMMELLKTPSPQAATTYYIVKGNKQSTKIYKRVTSNDSGIIKVSLPSGTYSLLTAAQVKKFKAKENTDVYDWDIECLKKMYRTPVLIFNVGIRKTFSFNVHQNCIYSQECGKFKGQYPG